MASHPWQGGCVRRIREALAAFVARIDDLSRCRNEQYAEALGLLFRDSAWDLYIELIQPALQPPMTADGALRPALLLADDRLPASLSGSLDWLADIFELQMQVWNWLGRVDAADHWVPVTRVNRTNVDRFHRALDRLDTAIQDHDSPPQPKKRWEDDWGGFEAMCKAAAESRKERDDALQDVPHYVSVENLEGVPKRVDLNTTQGWLGTKEFNGFECYFGRDLHRTKGGKWILCEVWEPTGVVIEELPPPDRWTEVTLDDAADWFALSWDRRPNDPPVPAEVGERIEANDLDHQPGEEERPPAKTEPRRGKRGDSKQRARIVAAYWLMTKAGENPTDRAIVRAIERDHGVSYNPGVVNRALKELRQRTSDLGNIPRGSKDRGGRMEAGTDQ